MNVKCLAIILLVAGCAPVADTHDPYNDLGLLWVNNSGEYRAVSMQAYAIAEHDLPGFIYDDSWSALPGQTDAGDLPPAVILDVDETVISNVEFQLAHERPFANHKLDTWNQEHTATPVPGVVEFVAAARLAGVEVFFVTNQPCEPLPADEDTCPQEKTTLKTLADIGIDTTTEHVMLSGEQPEWSREKSIRRELIAETHRVIMLIGDDLGDFLKCSRPDALPPCTVDTTSAIREAMIEEHRDYWGHGWYVLPNPMHGSWASSDY